MSTIVLWSDRFDECAEFYRRLLTAKTQDRSENFLNVVGETGRVALHRVPAEWASEISSPPVAREDNPIKPVFTVASIAEARTAVADTEGKVFDESKEFRHGRLNYCDALDPDGNVIQICEEIAE